MDRRIGGRDHPAALPGRPAVPRGDDAPRRLDDGNRRGDVIGVQPGLDHQIDLALREQDLRAMSDLVGEQIARLSAAETSLRQVMSLAEGAAEGDVAQLTAVYAAMKPKEAAAVFEEMDPAFAAGFLGRMKPDAAAQIVAGLSPGKAYSISVILAGRNVGTPTE